jgi:hypothetical protein
MQDELGVKKVELEESKIAGNTCFVTGAISKRLD